MMNRRVINDTTVGGLFLLFFLLAINLLKGFSLLSEPYKDPCYEKLFVEISGVIKHPGVYECCYPPSVHDLVDRAGGLILKTYEAPMVKDRYYSGSNVDLQTHGGELCVSEGEMSAFYKVTLGIPISINSETMEGLTAIPGIGPKTAGAIIGERAKGGGFHKLRELLSVKGIGPGLYRKICPYLVL